MPKKSAASKGYRKTVKAKPFLSKKEIIALIAILAAIVLVVVLFNLFYDDGYVAASEVQEGDIVAYATRDVTSRYAKLGVANELEGFTRTEQGSQTNKLVAYYYTPDAPIDHIDFISVSGSFINADELSTDTLANYAGEGITASERFETTVQGYDAYIYGATISSYNPELDTQEAELSADESAQSEATSSPEATAEAVPEEEVASSEETSETDTSAETAPENQENAPNTFRQNLSCYVAVDDTHTLAFHIYLEGEDESFYLADDEIVDFVLSYTNAFTLVPPKA